MKRFATGILAGALACSIVACSDSESGANSSDNAASNSGSNANPNGTPNGSPNANPNGAPNGSTNSGANASTCGDGSATGTEVCDESDLGGATCATLGYASGDLACDASCRFDASACEGSTAEGDLAAYLGSDANDRLNAIHRLSDGTFVVGGRLGSLDVLGDVEVTELPVQNIDSNASEGYAVLLHMSPDLSTILSAAHLPANTAGDISRIRSTEVPGQPTGDLYVSGRRDGASEDGYFIARLNGNFVDAAPTEFEWTYDVRARPRQASGGEGESAYKALQPWDVSADGEVIFGSGAEYDFRWAQISKLDADGNEAVVEHWPVHWMADGEHRGSASDAPDPVERSGIVLKAGRAGSLRSTTQAEFDAMVPDGNGGMRQGTWPDDYFFSGPCIPGGDCPGGPGYTGYRTSDKPTQRLGAIVIDRRTGDHYFGYSTQSVLPGGNPDFEPAVVAMAADGSLKWVQRLYEETNDNSTPDQYVDGMALDYANDQVVVLARAHGNNVVNLWKGENYFHNPDAPNGFQKQFTGTNGNIHISWLGKFTTDEGNLMHATYLGELNEGLSGSNGTFDASRPLLEGYPNPEAGWPDMNTTRCRGVEVDLQGRVAVTCTGRRTITTLNAFQRMPRPDEGRGVWNEFARVYTPDLGDLIYSTLLVGEWDWQGEGPAGGNTRLGGLVLAGETLAVVGYHQADENGAAQHTPIPVASVPAWAGSTPTGEEGIFARFDIAAEIE